MINGPEAFTPDNEFILGESEVRGFFVAAGFCAHGIAGAGGIGRQMASWIVDGEPELDLWKMDIRRFGAAYRSRAYTLARIDRELRDLLRHPLPERGARGRPAAAHVADVRGARGARCRVRREVRLGASELVRAQRGRPAVRRTGGARGAAAAGWAGRHWSPAIGAEALATRQAAAGSSTKRSFAKIEVSGPGACAFLQSVAGNDIDRPVGSIVYTQLLDPRGGIEADLTVTRLAEDRFLLVTGTAFGNHDAAWLAAAPPRRRATAGVAIRDLTSARVCFGAVGAAGPRHPRSAHAATTCPTPGSRT